MTSPDRGAVPSPKLDQVTLLAVSSVAVAATIRALRNSMRHARFGRVLFLSDKCPPLEFEDIEWRQIRAIRSRSDYSRFMLHELAPHVTTTHALCVQWDGYVLNQQGWDPDFLNYDFIGAPWPHFTDAHNVGNGGFSLRSRRLLELCGSLPADGFAEDVTLCRTYREQLEKEGMIYAPKAVASRFSYERGPRRGDEFGFHGVFNLIDHLKSSEFLEIIRSLEPNLLSPCEHREILRSAIKSGKGKIAFALVRRMLPFRKPFP